ncbi:MAG: glycosyltransferase family 4 protein [Vicingaceae bacterium]|nr:glycosyltransferase family 4 protein [Vicingaceae bacterium]
MVKTTKICHLTSAHPDGDLRIFYKECVSLAKAGFEVSLVIPNTNSRIENKVNIVSFESNYITRKERMTKAVNDVLKHALIVNADIYHIHDPELLKIVKHLKKKGKKVIYDAHEDLPRQMLSKHWISKPLRKILSVFMEIYENNIAKKCDGVITATPFIKDRFIKVNPNTTDINNFPIIEELLIDYDYSKKTDDYICYVGGITKTRGIIELVTSISDLDCKLLLAGKFLEENLREETSKLGGWEKVEEQGFLNRNEVKELYKKSKIGIVTLHPTVNYLDSLPVKMFEYMAAGIPVIASNFPLWKSIIETNNCGLCVDPLDSKATSIAINNLLNNPDLSKEMGENGKTLVQQKYNWKNEEIKLIDFYKRIIE